MDASSDGSLSWSIDLGDLGLRSVPGRGAGHCGVGRSQVAPSFTLVSESNLRRSSSSKVLQTPCYLTLKHAMSVGSPTVIPRSPLFPDLLPRPPEPHPLPLPRYGQPPRRFNQVRDLLREMDDLSSEEEELDEIVRYEFSLVRVISLICSSRTQIYGTGGLLSWSPLVGSSRNKKRRTM